jgi:hypothetical protein
MINGATSCIWAFWVLDMVAQEDQQILNLWTYNFGTLYTTLESDELDSIEFWTCIPVDLNCFYHEAISPWSLRFIAAHSLGDSVGNLS